MTTMLLDVHHWAKVLGLDAFQEPARQPEIARDFRGLNWSRAVNDVSFSIDLSGEWSPRQAFRVMEVVRPEAEANGLMVVPVNVSTHGGPKRVIILVLCRRHDVPVARNTVCSKCREEFPV